MAHAVDRAPSPPQVLILVERRRTVAQRDKCRSVLKTTPPATTVLATVTSPRWPLRNRGAVSLKQYLARRERCNDCTGEGVTQLRGAPESP